MKTVTRAVLGLGLAVLLTGGEAHAGEAKTGLTARLGHCPQILPQLIVPAPRAEKTALFQRLNGQTALRLSDRQAVEILGWPQTAERAFVRRFLAMTIKAQERERARAMGELSEDDGPTWMSTDEEFLIALKGLAASGDASTLRPFLLKVVTNRVGETPPTGGDFQIEDCGDSLMVDPLGVTESISSEIPLVVFLSHTPTRVEVVGGGPGRQNAQ